MSRVRLRVWWAWCGHGSGAGWLGRDGSVRLPVAWARCAGRSWPAAAGGMGRLPVVRLLVVWVGWWLGRWVSGPGFPAACRSAPGQPGAWVAGRSWVGCGSVGEGQPGWPVRWLRCLVGSVRLPGLSGRVQGFGRCHSSAVTTLRRPSSSSLTVRSVLGRVVSKGSRVHESE